MKATTINPLTTARPALTPGDGWVKLSHSLIRHSGKLGMTSQEFHLIALLMSYQHGRTGETYPSQETLAYHLDVSVRQARRILQDMADKGLIMVARRRREPSRYFLAPLLAKLDDLESVESGGIAERTEAPVQPIGEASSPQSGGEAPVVENPMFNHEDIISPQPMDDASPYLAAAPESVKSIVSRLRTIPGWQASDRRDVRVAAEVLDAYGDSGWILDNITRMREYLEDLAEGGGKKKYKNLVAMLQNWLRRGRESDKAYKARAYPGRAAVPRKEQVEIKTPWPSEATMETVPPALAAEEPPVDERLRAYCRATKGMHVLDAIKLRPQFGLEEISA